MFWLRKNAESQHVADGVLGTYLGGNEAVNAMHWIFDDNTALARHSHAAVQFGYIIRGAFRMIIGDLEMVLQAGDSYTIPPNVEHEFVSIGETEAIDVFTPARAEIPPWKKGVEM